MRELIACGRRARRAGGVRDASATQHAATRRRRRARSRSRRGGSHSSASARAGSKAWLPASGHGTRASQAARRPRRERGADADGRPQAAPARRRGRRSRAASRRPIAGRQSQQREHRRVLARVGAEAPRFGADRGDAGQPRIRAAGALGAGPRGRRRQRRSVDGAARRATIERGGEQQHRIGTAAQRGVRFGRRRRGRGRPVRLPASGSRSAAATDRSDRARGGSAPSAARSRPRRRRSHRRCRARRRLPPAAAGAVRRAAPRLANRRVEGVRRPSGSRPAGRPACARSAAGAASDRHAGRTRHAATARRPSRPRRRPVRRPTRGVPGSSKRSAA